MKLLLPEFDEKQTQLLRGFHKNVEKNKSKYENENNQRLQF